MIFFCQRTAKGTSGPGTKKEPKPKLLSEGEKPPKIRQKKLPGTKFLGTFGPPPTEKTEKIGKIKRTLVRKVPGNLRSQEFVFFFCAVFLPPFLGPDIFGWVGVFHVKGWRPKSSVCPSKPRQTKLFWWDIPEFCRDILGAPEKFVKKKFVFNSHPLESLGKQSQKGLDPLISEFRAYKEVS